MKPTNYTSSKETTVDVAPKPIPSVNTRFESSKSFAANCPFAQRVWACLLEKRVEFRLEKVNMMHKTEQRLLYQCEMPAWLLQLNPLGKV